MSGIHMVDALRTRLPDAEWLKGLDVSRATGLSRMTIWRMGRDGRITTRKFPGVRRALYWRADVEALVRASTKPRMIVYS